VSPLGLVPTRWANLWKLFDGSTKIMTDTWTTKISSAEDFITSLIGHAQTCSRTSASRKSWTWNKLVLEMPSFISYWLWKVNWFVKEGKESELHTFSCPFCPLYSQKLQKDMLEVESDGLVKSLLIDNACDWYQYNAYYWMEANLNDCDENFAIFKHGVETVDNRADLVI